MTPGDLSILAARAVSNAEALRDGRRGSTEAQTEASKIAADLRSYARTTSGETSVSAGEVYFATGFLLQATERWARYLQYQNEQDRADDWRDVTFAFAALVRNAVSREAA